MINKRVRLAEIIESYRNTDGERDFRYSISENEMTVYAILSAKESPTFQKTKKFLKKYNKKNCCKIKFTEYDFWAGRGEENIEPVFFLESLPFEKKTIENACSLLLDANRRLYKKLN